MKIYSFALLAGSASLLVAPPISAYTIDGTTVTVPGTQGSPWAPTNNLFVGDVGIGTLLIQNGGRVTSTGVAYIGRSTGSTGLVEVSGLGSQWDNSSYIYVGGGGDGTLNISQGGVVNNISGIVGSPTEIGSIATVSDAGSQWNNSGTLSIGSSGNGTLLIQRGGVVTSTGVAYIGNQAGSTGLVEVTDDGSQWNNNGNLSVGNLGDGTLNISQGGVVRSNSAYVGSSTDTGSVITVSGDGSQWINNGVLYVGNLGDAITGGGKGTLTMEIRALPPCPVSDLGGITAAPSMLA
jgi:autotransporter family porin